MKKDNQQIKPVQLNNVELEKVNINEVLPQLAACCCGINKEDSAN